MGFRAKYSVKLPWKTSCSMVTPWSISPGIPCSRVSPWNSMGFGTETAVLQDRQKQTRKRNSNKYIRSPYCPAEMYAGHVACCALVSHVEYAPLTLLRLKKDVTARPTDGRTPDRCITLTARRDQR